MLTPSMKHLNSRTDAPMTLHAPTPMAVHDTSVWGHYVCNRSVNLLWKICRFRKNPVSRLDY